jgi:hypothetical protein
MKPPLLYSSVLQRQLDFPDLPASQPLLPISPGRRDQASNAITTDILVDI